MITYGLDEQGSTVDDGYGFMRLALQCNADVS